MSFASAVQAAFKLTFQDSPIFLTGGIAQNIPGGVLPLLVITEALNLPLALASGTQGADLDGFFANYEPMPGMTLVDNDVPEYPLANQVIAANALIQKPLMIPMRMICPVRTTLGYAAKIAIMLLLQQTLQQHNRTGGTYTIATPSYFATNCIMLSMTDVTGGETKQKQAVWQLVFREPLLTVQAALAAQNSLMSKLSNGTQVNGTDSWSGASSNIGAPNAVAAPTQAAGSSVVTATPLPPVPGVPAAGFNAVAPIPSGFPTTG